MGDFRTEADYKGLHNLGATCYLNTVLQMLYMTRQFREAVEREECEDGLVLQLKKIFVDLKNTEGHTWAFADTLGIQNTAVQQDAAEYFQRILNSLSPHLSQMFQGTVKNSTVCLQGQHDTSIECSPFLILPLPLQFSNDSEQVHRLVDSWKAFFRTSVVDGDNQMYCDICEEKTDTKISCEMEHYPQVLTLQLQRFEFDYNRMCYVKNTGNVEVPFMLELETHTYDLYAIANHEGSYTGGHYVAHIKPLESQSWYFFDDILVGKLDPHEVIRPRSAYLLMYMKRERGNLPGPSPTVPETPKEQETPAVPETPVLPERPKVAYIPLTLAIPETPHYRQLWDQRRLRNQIHQQYLRKLLKEKHLRFMRCWMPEFSLMAEYTEYLEQLFLL